MIDIETGTERRIRDDGIIRISNAKVIESILEANTKGPYFSTVSVMRVSSRFSDTGQAWLFNYRTFVAFLQLVSKIKLEELRRRMGKDK